VTPLPPPLPPETLARRQQLPRKPASVEYQGQRIQLVPLDLDRDIEALHSVSDGRPITLGTRTHPAYDAEELIWRYLPGGPFQSAGELRSYLQLQVDAPNGLPFTVVDRLTDHPIGIINLLNNEPASLKIELGHIWYSPIAQRTGANLEATYMLLRAAFEQGYRRLEWKCNALNERSRHSALRMGFKFEGIQEFHVIVKDRSRDTAWFRMLDHEWPQVRQQLEAMLNR
jgi:RimJ/RimL family protein N-acetyltransferase